jgi:hypothetical protein
LSKGVAKQDSRFVVPTGHRSTAYGDLDTVRKRSLGWSLASGVATLAALSALFFWSSRDCLRSFFHFDDFWVLAAAHRVHIDGPWDLLQIFRPIHGLILYRPLSTVGYFYALRQIFGYNPVAYHAAQIAFHVLNGMLVYLIADRLFFGSRLQAAATALIYATAPGHALATCWNALFTMTGAAFFYFAALLAWVGWDRRGRLPATIVLFVLALLCSEHGVSLPLALTLASVLLLGHSGWRLLRELAPFYLLATGYAATKLYYVAFRLSDAFPDPMQRAVVQKGYAISLAPLPVLNHLGHYLSFALDALYALPIGEVAATVLGAAFLLSTIGVTVAAALRRWRGRLARIVAFGMGLFIVGLGPVLVLENHLYSYYVGIAAAGMALALVAVASMVPRVPRVAVVALLGLVLAVHFGVTANSVRGSEEFRFFRSFTRAATQWLYTLATYAEPGTVDEVIVPGDALTNMVFEVGRAHEIFLCAPYTVRTVQSPETEPSAPRRLIVSRPVPLPRLVEGSWSWLGRYCR